MGIKLGILVQAYQSKNLYTQSDVKQIIKIYYQFILHTVCQRNQLIFEPKMVDLELVEANFVL